MERKDFATLALTASITGILSPFFVNSKNIEEEEKETLLHDKGLPKNLPANNQQLITNVSTQKFSDVNTDWFGSVHYRQNKGK